MNAWSIRAEHVTPRGGGTIEQPGGFISRSVGTHRPGRLPGAGKSTIGRVVARKLHRPFVDFDIELERREGMSVSQLFAERGESAFRALEVKLTGELVHNEPSVFAPGGGWITNPGVLALVPAPGAYHSSQGQSGGCIETIGQRAGVTPTINGEQSRGSFGSSVVNRGALYALADAEVDTEVVDFQGVADRVVEIARGLDAALG